MNPVAFTTWFLCSLVCIVGGIALLGLAAKATVWTINWLYELKETLRWL